MHISASLAERFNRRMKDETGTSNIMVRGPQTVRMYVNLWVFPLFADQLLKLVTRSALPAALLSKLKSRPLILMWSALGGSFPNR
jgi:hypothetical protein